MLNFFPGWYFFFPGVSGEGKLKLFSRGCNFFFHGLAPLGTVLEPLENGKTGKSAKSLLLKVFASLIISVGFRCLLSVFYIIVFDLLHLKMTTSRHDLRPA